MREKQNEAPTIRKIIMADDITSHYLGAETQESKKFKIFRYNKEVYAVHYDTDQNPVDFVHMWSSHKGERKEDDKTQKEYIGSGQFGDVYKKTEDKAVKLFKRGQTIKGKVERNRDILEQKFLLKKHNIEKFFVLGLWNIKDQDRAFFYMPKVNTTFPPGFGKEQLKPLFDEFILALKELNDLGYSHPDLANHIYHISPQNMLRTVEGIKLIDLDTGFFPYKKYAEEQYAENPEQKLKTYIEGRDQWLYVYNERYTNPSSDRKNWRKDLAIWYEKNPGQSISDNPKSLLRLYKNGSISLPKSLAYEMHLRNSSGNVAEYLSGSKENRKHTFYEVSSEDFGRPEYKQEYQGIRGDALKRTILNELKDSLEDVKTKEELEKIKSKFLKSPEMKIIDKAQGRTTHILGMFHLKKTDSHKAVERIFKEAEKRISEPVVPHRLS